MTKKLDQDELNNAVWAACDTFRGAVDATRYKDLILAVLFWKYLSDHAEWQRIDLAKKYGPNDPRVERQMKRARFVLPEGTDFQTIHAKRQADNLGELINKALEKIELENEAKLKDVFRPIDFNSETLLGATKERNRLLKLLLEDFAKPSLALTPDKVSEDAIGEAYIYLISKFAADGGKKAGEYYTPRKISEIVAQLANPKPGMTICDPACGSGALLIRAGEATGSDDHRLFGQEVNGSTHALARMNMFLHGEDNALIEWCNTLTSPALIEDDRLMQFDRVVANPPFSLDKWGADVAETDPYKRFKPVIPPKSRGDYAFILHMLAIAKRGEGRVVCIAPHGVLFRGAAEGRIREDLVRRNLLDAVVGLPAQLFPSTGIPVCLLVFDRAREEGGARAAVKDVVFVDASREFVPGKRQNALGDQQVEHIVGAVMERRAEEKYSSVVTFAEMEANGFNLNIPRYVDTYEPEPEIDVAALQADIERLEGELVETRKRIKLHLAELESMVDPAPWLRGKLGDFFTVSKEKGVADLPMLSVTMRNGLVRRDSLDRKMDSELEDGDHLRVRPGDIAYNMMRMWQGASGLATEDGIVSPAYVVVRPKNAVDPLFASFWFKSQRMIYLFWAYSYGLTSDRLRLYGKDFTQIPVELPPLPDQRRIAEVLSDFDRAIEATDALVEAKQRRKRGLMQRAFGDVHNPFAIVGDELGKLCKIQYGSGVDAASYSPGGPSWVIGTSGVMGFSNVGTKIGPAIILGRKGTLNKPFFVPEGQMFSAIDTTFVVTAKQKLKVLYHFLTHLDLSKLNAASGVPSVSSETLQAQQVPTLTEFQGELLDSIDAEIEQLTAQGRRIRDQRRGLMQRLLSEPTRQSKSVTEGIAA